VKIFLALLSFIGLFWTANAQAQTGCVPNPNNSPPPFVDGCPLTAAGLNHLPLGSSVGYTSTAVCDGVTNVTGTIQGDLNADSALGGGAYYLPKAKGCVISNTITIPFNMEVVCVDKTGGYWPSGNYTANADILLSSTSSIIFSGSPGGRSGISGCLIVNQGYTTVTTLRQAITAAANFAGTAISCSGSTDVVVDNNTIIGFATAVTTGCDRFHFVDNRGDDTNFFSITACNDTCTVHDDEAWPFVGNPYVGFPQAQVTTVTSATFSGPTLTLGFSTPPTQFVIGDIVVLASIGGITGAQFGRFTVTNATPTSIKVSGSWGGAFTSGGTIYLSSMRRVGTAFNFGAAGGGGPLAARLYDYGHDIGLHYAGGSVAQCMECWMDGDTQQANFDPTPVGLQLDGSSGLTNAFQGFINVSGIAIYKNDNSILTVGPGTQMGSWNTSVGTYVIEALKGAIQFSSTEAFTNFGLGSGQVLYIGDNSTQIQVNGGALNGSTTFQTISTDCPKLITNGARGPCTYTPVYTAASIAGTPNQALWWADSSGKTTIYFQDNAKAVSGATSSQFSISLPTTAVFGGICNIGSSNITLPASTNYFTAYINPATAVAAFAAVGSNNTAIVPGTDIINPDNLQLTCTYE
jgi:hypothetical protein